MKDIDRGNSTNCNSFFSTILLTGDTTQFRKHLNAIAYSVDYCLHMYGLYKCVTACCILTCQLYPQKVLCSGDASDSVGLQNFHGRMNQKYQPASIPTQSRIRKHILFFDVAIVEPWVSFPDLVVGHLIISKSAKLCKSISWMTIDYKVSMYFCFAPGWQHVWFQWGRGRRGRDLFGLIVEEQSLDLSTDPRNPIRPLIPGIPRFFRSGLQAFGKVVFNVALDECYHNCRGVYIWDISTNTQRLAMIVYVESRWHFAGTHSVV